MPRKTDNQKKRLPVLLLVLAILMVCSSARATMYVVWVSKANLRTGPGRMYPTILQVDKGYVFQKIARKGDWLKVRDMDGDTAWIHRTLVRRKRIVVVKAKRVSVRKVPNKRGETIFQAEHGVMFSYKGRKGNWIKVSYSGYGTGWIPASTVWGNP